ncbi:MAG: M23 family metallopeptidase [Elusimicrobium sp.]|jgi:murein DD-endopeptidase MepM/ murein hydrolase activator NlpD|nr:M23 family metallopeptidase [Elusimicrobium sp.]
MQKIKNFFSAFYRGYCKVKEIIFYFLLAAIIACGVFIYVKDRDFKEKQMLSDVNAFPAVSVQEESFESTPLYTRLESAGMDRLQILAIVNKLDGVMQTRKLRKHDSYMLFTGDDGDFKLLVVTRDLSRYYVANIGGEHLVAGIIDIEVKTRVRTARGEIRNSLFNSMRSKGMEAPLIVAFTDVFSWNIDFNTETRNGDDYSVIWEEDYTAATNLVVDQRILAAKYEGVGAGKNYAFNFESDFFDKDGKISKRMFLKSPISFKGVRITSRFSRSRMHPILRIRRPHLGIDYAAPLGTPVEAVADGVVKFAGVEGGFGNYIEINHPNNYTTCYGHLKGFNVKTGEHVRQGKVVGFVGRTGLATGPHLDFRIREGVKYMDFLAMHNRNASVGEVPADKMKEFKALRDRFIHILDLKAAPEAPAPPSADEENELGGDITE